MFMTINYQMESFLRNLGIYYDDTTKGDGDVVTIPIRAITNVGGSLETTSKPYGGQKKLELRLEIDFDLLQSYKLHGEPIPFARPNLQLYSSPSPTNPYDPLFPAWQLDEDDEDEEDEDQDDKIIDIQNCQEEPQNSLLLPVNDNRIKKLIHFLENNYIDDNGNKTHILYTKNIEGDITKEVYNDDNIRVNYCSDYNYLELYGLTITEKEILKDEDWG